MSIYLIDVPSLDDAVEWALRCPSGLGSDDVLEVRALTDESDIPAKLRELVKAAAPTWSASFLTPGSRSLEVG